jgi:hypothetical protein
LTELLAEAREKLEAMPPPWRDLKAVPRWAQRSKERFEARMQVAILERHVVRARSIASGSAET